MTTLKLPKETKQMQKERKKKLQQEKRRKEI